MSRRKKAPMVELTGRDKILASIQDLHQAMRYEVLAAGVMDVHYDSEVKDLTNHTNEDLEQLLGLLLAIAEGPYAELLNVRKLRPVEWWVNMTGLFSQHQLREQKLLKAEQKKLRAAWRNRRGKAVDDKSPSESS